MKITNRFNVPETLVALASREYYSKGKADFSVTEIISPPRIQRLRRAHYDEMESDVADGLWALLGSALHVVAERSQVAGHTTEQRLTTEIDGVRLSGAIDVQDERSGGIVIIDYKFTSAWALRQDKPEWEQQQNIYAYLVETVKKKQVQGLKICALIRDWSRRDAMNSPDYPQAPIQMIDIPLWEMSKTEKFIKERIELHRDSKVKADWEEELPLCTEEERWVRETKYAVKKEGRKTAIRVYDSEAEAMSHLRELDVKEKAFIEIRKGEPVRCTGNFCGVAAWCSQYQKELKEGNKNAETA